METNKIGKDLDTGFRFERNRYQFLNLPEPTDRQGILKHIESIGRLCYRSDDAITEDSAVTFINSLKKRKHWAMLEHYVFVMSIPEWMYKNIVDRRWFTAENADLSTKFKFINVTEWPDAPNERYRYLISGSATAFNYLWACKAFKYAPYAGIPRVCSFLYKNIPEMMAVPADGNPDVGTDEISFLMLEEIDELPISLRKLHDWMSVKFTVERSSTHDLVRHRPVSYGQESTRWCNYNNKGFVFIIPTQFSERDKLILENHDMLEDALMNIDENPYALDSDVLDWVRTISYLVHQYKWFIGHGWSPQEAKSILPHCLRAEIVMTASKGEWHHIFDMRAAKNAFPQIQEVMVPLLDEMIRKDSDIYSDLYKRVEEGAKYIHVTE